MYNSRTKAIVFIGRSIDLIRAFPAEAKREAGFQLNKIQHGYAPTDWRPMKSVGVGAREIRVCVSGGVYRVIFVAKFEEAVYVLHAFAKKTQKTSKSDIEIARAAYRTALEASKE